MDHLVGTQNCPHLGFDLQGGRPCCHADEDSRIRCGKSVPNPAARNRNALGVEPFFCTALGTDSLPPEALRLAAQEKVRARQQSRPGYQPPAEVRGQLEPRPNLEYEEGQDPVIPTHTLRNEGVRTQPNAPCPCGSGRKFKKCCGRRG